MIQIDYFFATISPFAYLTGKRMEEVADAYGANVTYKPIDIMALFASTGGTPPKERHFSRADLRLQEIRRQSAKLGMKMNPQPAFWPTNAAPSAYAIIAAQAAGGGDMGELVHSVLRACWAEERDISQDDVIKDCLGQAGFDPTLADTGLLSGADTYAANLEEAVNRGVFGSPFYIVNDKEKFWGQDRIEDIGLHLAGKI